MIVLLALTSRNLIRDFLIIIQQGGYLRGSFVIRTPQVLGLVIMVIIITTALLVWTRFLVRRNTERELIELLGLQFRATED